MADSLNWPGKSGKTYTYHFLASLAADRVKAEPGNYIFAKRTAGGGWTPLYIGKAENLSARLSNHDRWDEAVRLGATHAYAHTSQGTEQSRLNEERDLIQRWNPPLNTHHRNVG